MIVLDTNVLARFLLNDDPEQFERARSVLSAPEAYTAPPTVFLELAWVLKANDCSREEISKGLRALLGLANFVPREPEVLLCALNWYEQGMDFGDAMHLAASAQDDALLTFDRDFAKISNRMGASPKVKSLGD